MKRLLIGSFLLLLILSYSTYSTAQEQYGHIRGKVADEELTPLPGVTITLESSLYAPRSRVTSPGGIFRFINISPGFYILKCELSGFKTYIQENIDIRVGTNFDFNITLKLESIEEEVTVIASSPIVDTKKVGTATNVTQNMLQQVPSARDPWVILQQVPGVLVGSENVGGSQSGQQHGYQSKGAFTYWGMWNMDGIPITDMYATGSSAMYYDFDSFEEMEIVTSGQKAGIQTGGVSINFVTRRGGNRFGLMGRIFFTNHDLQADNRTQEIIDLGYVGDRINQILDYGFQGGGPIIKDKLSFWLGYGVQDIRRLTIDGYPNESTLTSYNAKINFQLSRSNRAEMALILPGKIQHGRLAGPFNPPETTQDLKSKQNFYIKLEDEHTLSENFLLSLKLSHFYMGFEAIPKGGMDVTPGYDLLTGMYSGSTNFAKGERPSTVAKLDGNYFLEGFLGGNHEISFGLEYRLIKGVDHNEVGGGVWKYYWNGEPFAAALNREQRLETQTKRFSFFLNDAFSIGRLTLNLGLRLDLEKSVVNESSVRANPLAPELLPALTLPELDPGVSHNTLSPRIGFTLDLTGDQKTILRGNLAQYGGQMSTQMAAHVSPSKFTYVTYFWKDLDGNDQVSLDELIGYPTSGIIDFSSGFDPSNPTQLESFNAIGSNLKSPLIDEVLLGVDREIFTDFSLGLNITFRRLHRYYWRPYYDKETDTKITQENYIGPISGTLTYEGKTYNYEYWTLNRYRPSGQLMENMPGYRENYRGLELTAIKRLSRRWMMNGSFSYQVHTQHYKEKSDLDPTNLDKIDGGRANSCDWLAKLSFLYQLPWGFNLSFFANARQGTLNSERIKVRTPERQQVGLESSTYIYTHKIGEKRLPNFYNMDIGLAKEFRFGDFGVLTLSIDAFNVFNFAHDLDRYTIANSDKYGQITQILNPRVIRFGLRYRY